MTVRDRGDELFDPLVAACLQRAADDVPVNIEVEWVRLVDRLGREAEELATISDVDAAPARERRTRVWSAGPLLAVAAVIIVLLVIAGPVFVRTTVTVARFVQEVVEPSSPDPDPQATTTTRSTAPPTTFALVPPPTPTPTSPPPPPTTTAPPPPPTTAPAATDLAHAPIRDGSEYRLTLRRVHEQINDAIGFGRTDYEALDGADGLVESMLGQRPEYDARLRDVIGHLRQARNFSDRNAASAAHTIVEEIERELASG